MLQVLVNGPRRALSLLSAVALVGWSHPTFASTIVGNPTKSVLAPMSGIVVTGIGLPISEVQLVECGASPGPWREPELVLGRLVFGVEEDTCEVRVALDGPVLVAGYSVSGSLPVELELSVPTLVLVFDHPFSPADGDDALVLEFGLPGWTSAQVLLPPGSTGIYVTDGHALHDTLVEALVKGSAVFADTNGNGHLDSGERPGGPLAETQQ